MVKVTGSWLSPGHESRHLTFQRLLELDDMTLIHFEEEERDVEGGS